MDRSIAIFDRGSRIPQTTAISSPAIINVPKSITILSASFKERKNERGKIKRVNCGLNHVSNWRGFLKNPRNIKNRAPNQNAIVSNNVREGISFADAAKASNQFEIAIPISPASIQ